MNRSLWILALLLAAAACDDEPSAGADMGASDAGPMIAADGAQDAGDGGPEPDGSMVPPAPTVGPGSLWAPVTAELEAMSLDELLLHTPVRVGGGERVIDFVPPDALGPGTAPASVVVPLSGREGQVALVWGMTHSDMDVWPQQAVIDFLGRDVFEGPDGRLALPSESVGTPVGQNQDLFRCRSGRRRARAPDPARAGDPAALRASSMRVRVAHPFMLALPLDEAGAIDVRTHRALVRAPQHTTTGDGFDWLRFRDGAREDTPDTNDVLSVSDGLRRLLEDSARNHAPAVWIGDVVFPARWAEFDSDEVWGMSCERRPGWRDGNDFVGLMNMTLAALSHLGDLSDDDLRRHPALAYVRPRSVGASLLQRYMEDRHPDVVQPTEFHTAGGSKGGMGCLYTLFADLRFKMGLCSVYDIFDFEQGETMIDRWESDWRLCARGGLTAEGCPTHNMPNSGPPSVQGMWRAETPAAQRLRDALEPARFLDRLGEINPGARLWMPIASTDFHYPVGSNQHMWTHRPPDPDVVRLHLMMNGDHGSHHLPPDDGVEPITLREWSHGAIDQLAFSEFFGQRPVPAIRWIERPEVVEGRLRARGLLRGGAGAHGARAYVARSRDRDFSFCTGMEIEDLVVCTGRDLCTSDREACGVPAEDCAGPLADAAQHMPLLQHTSAPHYCVLREAPAGDFGDSYARFCTDHDADGAWDLEEIPTAWGGADAETGEALPLSWAFRDHGENSSEAIFQRFGYVYPYARDADGALRHRDSGLFMPIDAELTVVETADGSELVLDLPIEGGADAPDHFAVALVGWDTPPEGLAGMVFTDIAVVDNDDDADRYTCPEN